MFGIQEGSQLKIAKELERIADALEYLVKESK